MTTYLCFLGTHPDLSLAEIRNLADLFGYHIDEKRSDDTHAYITTDDIDTEKLMHRLGGTIKIARSVSVSGDWPQAIASYLDSATLEGKIQFSLTASNKKLPLQVKKILKGMGRSVRYIEPKNTATILHNNLVAKKGDLTLAQNTLFVTEAIQPIEDLSYRDYDRPGRSGKRGMLPPKLAKIMINLAGQPTSAHILDPFCGSGTVLSEAALMGYTNLHGTDLSDDAVRDTKENVAWTQKEYQLSGISIDVQQSNATMVHEKIQKESIHTIITEPYLGKPLTGNEPHTFLRGQSHELKELYNAAFRSFTNVLKPGATVVCVFPEFLHENSWITTDISDDIVQIGFTPIPLTNTSPSIRYHRPGQHLGRRIAVFTYNK